MADHVYKLREVPKGQRIAFFWQYYRWPVLAGIVVLALAVSLLWNMFLRPRSDFSLLAVTGASVDADALQTELDTLLDADALDLNGDGRTTPDTRCLTLTENSSDPYGSDMQLSVLLASGEYSVCLVDDEGYTRLSDAGALGVWGTLGDSTGHDADETVKLPASESPYLSGLSDADGLYLCLTLQQSTDNPSKSWLQEQKGARLLLGCGAG